MELRNRRDVTLTVLTTFENFQFTKTYLHTSLFFQTLLMVYTTNKQNNYPLPSGTQLSGIICIPSGTQLSGIIWPASKDIYPVTFYHPSIKDLFISLDPVYFIILAVKTATQFTNKQLTIIQDKIGTNKNV